MTWKRLLIAAVLVGLSGATTLAQSPDPMVGTWKLNAAKSDTPMKRGCKPSSRRPATGSRSLWIWSARKHRTSWAFTAKYDGKDNPVTGTSPYGNVVALTRVNPHTVRIDVKQDGKTTVTQTMVVSDDGKTRTITTKGRDAKGQPVDTTSVYDKQ